MRIVVYNLGCKVNQYETDAMIRELKQRGHEVYDDFTAADAYILNTCAVTNEAERKSRQAITRALRCNPTARIIVCGCASEHDARQFAEKSGVTVVTGSAGKARIPDLFEGKTVEIKELPREYEDDLMTEGLRTRAFMKVQDGCNNYCSYCIIPYLRGRSRSRGIASVVSELERLSARVNEIVLTGINLSAYGQDIGSSLTELIAALNSFDVRLRLGSLEVNVIDEAFLEALKGLKRFCPQFHLSLQSGDDGVLMDMNRHYTTAQYLEKTRLIREFFPSAAITTDLICAYPTESEESFLRTLDFIKRVGFAEMHIFVYSPRQGTRAAALKQLPGCVARARASAAAEVAAAMKEEYLKAHIGVPLEVLFEKGSGYSREYIKVYGDGADGELRTVVPAKIYLDGLR